MNKIMELAKNAVEIGCSHMLGGASVLQVETAWRDVQAEVTRLETEVADLHVEIDTCHRRMIAEGAKLAALEAQKPFWHAVVSKQSPVVNKAMRRRDVAEEYADQCRPNYSGIEVVALYLAAGAKPESEKPDAWDTLGSVRMKLCPTCGNKRCPKATNEALACTGSNEAGQLGSSWEHVKPFGAKEPNHG